MHHSIIHLSATSKILVQWYSLPTTNLLHFTAELLYIYISRYTFSSMHVCVGVLFYFHCEGEFSLCFFICTAICGLNLRYYLFLLWALFEKIRTIAIWWDMLSCSQRTSIKNSIHVESPAKWLILDKIDFKASMIRIDIHRCGTFQLVTKRGRKAWDLEHMTNERGRERWRKSGSLRKHFFSLLNRKENKRRMRNY